MNPINRALTTVLLLMIAVLTSGCSTLDRAECETGDWQSHGYSDGAQGAVDLNFNNFTRKPVPNMALMSAWMNTKKGHRLGLIDFCIPSTGHLLGLQESEYSYVCPDELETDFLIAYGDGLRTASWLVESTTVRIGRPFCGMLACAAR